MSRHSREKQQSQFGLVIAGMFAVVALIIGIAGWLVLGDGFGSSVERGTVINVAIKEGSSTSAIADALKSAGVISNPLSFRVHSRLAHMDGKYKAGNYRFIAGQSISNVIDTLSKGPKVTSFTVTIPEGKTILQIGEILQQKAGINAQDFANYAQSAAPDYAGMYSFLKGAYNNSLEGYLFPDTYQIDADATVQDIVVMMLRRFDEVYSSLSVSKARSQRYTTNQLVTIASLVEREVSRDEDRPLAASVIDNRIEKNMRLQLCSTVQFLLPGQEERTKIRLTNADISIQSPYNTYKNPGLPPGPIANPGKASLEAAIAPAKTNYLYFQVVDTKGTTKFDVSLEDFNKTKAKAKAKIGQ